MREWAGSIVGLLLLGACATAPRMAERNVAGSTGAALARAGTALAGLGFGRATSGPETLTAATQRVDPAWAVCPPVLVSDGDDRRVMASAEARTARVTVTATPGGDATAVRVEAAFAATYRNRLRATSFERACRSIGRLEALLLDAAGG